MGLRCFLFGCRYKETVPNSENGIFTITGKCIVCGKEKVLVREDIHTVYKMLGLDDFEKKLKEKISQRGLG